jgi:hypothetical protein
VSAEMNPIFSYATPFTREPSFPGLGIGHASVDPPVRVGSFPRYVTPTLPRLYESEAVSSSSSAEEGSALPPPISASTWRLLP